VHIKVRASAREDGLGKRAGGKEGGREREDGGRKGEGGRKGGREGGRDAPLPRFVFTHNTPNTSTTINYSLFYASTHAQIADFGYAVRVKGNSLRSQCGTPWYVFVPPRLPTSSRAFIPLTIPHPPSLLACVPPPATWRPRF